MNSPFNVRSSRISARRSWGIEHLPGLGVRDQQKLLECGISTTQQLLSRTRSLAEKQAIAAQLQVHLQHVQKWAALADLARVPAVGCQYCGVLLHAGICSSAQLAQAPLQTLHKQILRFYVATLQRQDLCPSRGQMAQWIQQAQDLRSGGKIA